jgi:hypothetical protein
VFPCLVLARDTLSTTSVGAGLRSFTACIYCQSIITALANGNDALYSSVVVLIRDQSGQGLRQARVNVRTVYAGHFVFLSDKHTSSYP